MSQSWHSRLDWTCARAPRSRRGRDRGVRGSVSMIRRAEENAAGANKVVGSAEANRVSWNTGFPRRGLRREPWSRFGSLARRRCSLWECREAEVGRTHLSVGRRWQSAQFARRVSHERTSLKETVVSLTRTSVGTGRMGARFFERNHDSWRRAKLICGQLLREG